MTEQKSCTGRGKRRETRTSTVHMVLLPPPPSSPFPRAHLVRVHVDPHQEDKLGHEEAAAQVLVDGRAGALDLAEEPEGEDAHGQADEGDDHAQLGDPGQDGAVGPQLRSETKPEGASQFAHVSSRRDGRQGSGRAGGQESEFLSLLWPDVPKTAKTATRLKAAAAHYQMR